MNSNIKDQLKQVVNLLDNDKFEIKFKGIGIILQYLDVEYFDVFIENKIVSKLINMLKIPNLVHKVQILLLNLSSHAQFINEFLNSPIIEKEIALIFNIMKQLKEEDLTILKSLLKKNINKPIGESLIEWEINDKDRINSKELIPMLNLDNLRFGILIISNLVSLNDNFKSKFLKLDDNNEVLHGNDFYIFFEWFINPKLYNIFNYFSLILISLTNHDQSKNILIKKENHILSKLVGLYIEDIVIHKLDIIKVIKNLCFMYENKELITNAIKRDLFKKLLNSYKKLKLNYNVNNKEELEILLDIFLVLTNVDFTKYEIKFSDYVKLEDLEIFNHKEFYDEETIDKLDVINTVYSGNFN